jgi:hypothetical protein
MKKAERRGRSRRCVSGRLTTVLGWSGAKDNVLTKGWLEHNVQASGTLPVVQLDADNKHQLSGAKRNSRPRTAIRR